VSCDCVGGMQCHVQCHVTVLVACSVHACHGTVSWYRGMQCTWWECRVTGELVQPLKTSPIAIGMQDHINR
jgi:hypothetical protein